MENVIGIDVSKASLEIACDNQVFQIANTSSAVEDFLMQLEIQQPLVVCEATGGYENGLVRTLKAQEISFHIAHPNKNTSLC